MYGEQQFVELALEALHLNGGRRSSLSATQVDGRLETSDQPASLLASARQKAATLDNDVCQRIASKCNHHHHPDCSYSRLRPRRASVRLHPSPSSASSHSNTSSLFRDDGFEDDLNSTASERTSSCHQGSGASTSSSGASSSSHHNNNNTNNNCNARNIDNQRHRLHHRNSISRFHHHRLSYQDRGSVSSHHQCRVGEEDDEYQSCYEDGFSNSQTTASTTSNLDDCALSTTSSSVIHHEQQLFDNRLSLAEAKQQYRKSLLLEHQHIQQQLQQQNNSANNNTSSNQSKIQSLLLASPQAYRNCPFVTPAKGVVSSGIGLGIPGRQNGQLGASPTTTSPSVTKQTKLDDRTVNIIGHMPTRSPGYWDSNLSITQRVVTEIIETERTYVDDLELIVTGYICYLRNIIKQQKQLQQQIQRNHKQSQQIHIASLKSNRQDEKNIDLIDKSNNNVLRTGTRIGDTSGNKNNTHNGQLDEQLVDSHQFGIISQSIDDDNKSMMIFDDDMVGGEVDDYDVDDPTDDIKENYSSHLDHEDSQTQRENHYQQQQNHQHHHKCQHSALGSPHHQPSSMSGPDQKLDQDLNAGAVMTAGYLKKLFSNLEDIYKFNKDLLFRLEECYLNPSSVAECFVENAAGFDVYTQYCTMYPQVVSTLTELMANPASAQLLRQRQNELNQSLPLGAYLLKPVQRILKYHILFQSLIKHTNEDDTVDEKDRQLISEAFSVMTSIACHINAMKKRHEHAIRVQEVQGLLSDWEGPDLTTLGELILEDTFKLYHRPKSTRHLLLFDNVLLITKIKRDGSLSYKGHIACSNLMLIEKIEGQPLVFETVPFDNPKALLAFQSKNLDKKRDWCLHMKEVIIKSFEVKIPVHVRDILMSLTTNGSTEGVSPKSSDSNKALKAPSYLQKKKFNKDKKKGN